MSMGQTADVLVVGNGVIGLSIAYELARREPKLRIVLCGPDNRGGAASAAAGAMLSAFGEVTKSTLTSAAGQAKFQLGRDALDRWTSWLDQLTEMSGVSDLRRTLSHGTTIIHNAMSGSLDDANLAAQQEALVRFDEPYEEIDPRDVPGLDPVPQARPLRALHLPREGGIDARHVLNALDVVTAKLGVQRDGREVAALLTQGERVSGVRYADGDMVAAETVVVAAGAFSDGLLDVLPLGAIPRTVSGKGIAALTHRTAGAGFTGVVRTPTRSGACGLHVVPFGNGVEYLGATNEVYPQPHFHADLGLSEFLLTCAYEQLALGIYKSQIKRWFVGNRPATVDGYPLLGRTTSVSGLILATGTYRDGFHCSPVIAGLVADDVLGQGSLARHVPMFAPERAPIEVLTPDEAVEEFAMQAVAGGFEDGMKLPAGYGGTAILDDHYRRAARRYYDALDEPIGLGMDVLLSVVFDAAPAKLPITRYLNAARRYHGVSARAE